jgi:hypothetical protein
VSEVHCEDEGPEGNSCSSRGQVPLDQCAYAVPPPCGVGRCQTAVVGSAHREELLMLSRAVAILALVIAVALLLVFVL